MSYKTNNINLIKVELLTAIYIAQVMYFTVLCMGGSKGTLYAIKRQKVFGECLSSDAMI